MRTIILWTVFHWFFIATMFSCVGCAGMPAIEMEDIFRPHVARFLTLCEEYGTVQNQEKCAHAEEKLRSIKFIDEAPKKLPDAVGLCYENAKTGNRVVFVQEFFLKLNYEQRSRLVGHELGHCILGLDHTPFGLMVHEFPLNDMPVDDLIISAVGEIP